MHLGVAKARQFQKQKPDTKRKSRPRNITPLRGRFRGAGESEPPRFWYFWLPKVHRPLRLRRIINKSIRYTLKK